MAEKHMSIRCLLCSEGAEEKVEMKSYEADLSVCHDWSAGIRGALQ